MIVEQFFGNRGGISPLATFSVAHFTIDDVEVVAVLLDSSFNSSTPEQTRALCDSLQECAARAGLGGTVVAVWRDASGHSRFLAPPEQHAFFQIVSYAQLAAQANRTLECG